MHSSNWRICLLLGLALFAGIGLPVTWAKAGEPGPLSVAKPAESARDVPLPLPAGTPYPPPPPTVVPGAHTQGPAGWVIEVVERGEAGNWVGRHASLVLDAAGQPHISYYDDIYDEVRYAHYDGSSWQIDTVYSTLLGRHYTSLALDSAGRPHIINCWSGCNGYVCFCMKLVYAHHDGTAWITETVRTGYMGRPSLALDGRDHPHISFCEWIDGLAHVYELDYARYDGSLGQGRGWQIETVDRVAAWNLSLVIDATGHSHMAYSDNSSHSLKYARYDGSLGQGRGWQIETVSTPGDWIYDLSLALDTVGRPHIAYYDSTNADLKYVYYDGSAWHVETVDHEGNVGYYTSLALDAANRPHISYYDDTNESFKYAYYDGSLDQGRGWRIETVDSTGSAGLWTSLALDQTGQAHVVYYGDYSLKYAHRAMVVPLPDTGGMIIGLWVWIGAGVLIWTGVVLHIWARRQEE